MPHCSPFHPWKPFIRNVQRSSVSEDQTEGNIRERAGRRKQSPSDACIRVLSAFGVYTVSSWVGWRVEFTTMMFATDESVHGCQSENGAGSDPEARGWDQSGPGFTSLRSVVSSVNVKVFEDHVLLS